MQEAAAWDKDDKAKKGVKKDKMALQTEMNQLRTGGISCCSAETSVSEALHDWLFVVWET